MKKINLKGMTAEAVTGVFILAIALINAILQIFGIHTLPINNEEVSELISALFLTISAFYNVYKNRNITVASQKAQEITNAFTRNLVSLNQYTVFCLLVLLNPILGGFWNKASRQDFFGLTSGSMQVPHS